MKSTKPPKLIFLTLRSRWHQKRDDEEKTQSSTTLYSNQHIWAAGGEKRKWSWGLKSSQIALLFFPLISWNVSDYHETRKLNSFFHLSNNWFDISEHFKGSLARRLCSKLQYKAEDLPLAECQVRSDFSPLFLSLYLPFWNSSQTLHNLSPPLCLCASRSAGLL